MNTRMFPLGQETITGTKRTFLLKTSKYSHKIYGKTVLKTWGIKQQRAVGNL